MKHQALIAGVATVLVFAGPAWAAPMVYAWTGPGVNVSGSSKCPTYNMTITVTVDGKNVVGKFQQQGRPERHFEATLGDDGRFKTKAEVGGGGTMDVTGAVSEKDNRILLDGYCKFGGPLNKR